MADIFARVPLTALKVFVAACEHRTFTAAAGDLGVTQAAVSRQVARLEALLGMRLFERGRRHLALTPEGRDLAREIAPHFAALGEAVHRSLEEGRDRAVSLRVYPTFADRWLLPRIAGFEAAHPEVRLRYDMTVEPLDIRSTAIDVAIQLGDGRWEGARTRLLFGDAMRPVCAPGYLARMGGDPARALAEGRLLTSRYRRRDWEDWAEGAGVGLPSGARLSFASSAMTYRAAECGLGVAIGQVALVRDAMAAGVLVPLGPAVARRGAAFHLVWPANAATRRPTRALVDWLLQTCGRPRAFT